MKRNWYLVAHRAGARIFEQQGIDPSLTLVREIENPVGQLKDGEIVSDRQGRPAPGYATFAPQQAPSDRVLDDFVRTIGETLETAVQQRSFDSLNLVAEPQVLGRLREKLSNSVLKLVRTSVAKDLARVGNREIGGHLEEVLLRREPVQ